MTDSSKKRRGRVSNKRKSLHESDSVIPRHAAIPRPPRPHFHYNTVMWIKQDGKDDQLQSVKHLRKKLIEAKDSRYEEHRDLVGDVYEARVDKDKATPDSSYRYMYTFVIEERDGAENTITDWESWLASESKRGGAAVNLYPAKYAVDFNTSGSGIAQPILAPNASQSTTRPGTSTASLGDDDTIGVVAGMKRKLREVEDDGLVKRRRANSVSSAEGSQGPARLVNGSASGELFQQNDIDTDDGSISTSRQPRPGDGESAYVQDGITGSKRKAVLAYEEPTRMKKAKLTSDDRRATSGGADDLVIPSINPAVHRDDEEAVPTTEDTQILDSQPKAMIRSPPPSPAQSPIPPAPLHEIGRAGPHDENHSIEIVTRSVWTEGDNMRLEECFAAFLEQYAMARELLLTEVAADRLDSEDIIRRFLLEENVLVDEGTPWSWPLLKDRVNALKVKYKLPISPALGHDIQSESQTPVHPPSVPLAARQPALYATSNEPRTPDTVIHRQYEYFDQQSNDDEQQSPLSTPTPFAAGSDRSLFNTSQSRINGATKILRSRDGHPRLGSVRPRSSSLLGNPPVAGPSTAPPGTIDARARSANRSNPNNEDEARDKDVTPSIASPRRHPELPQQFSKPLPWSPLPRPRRKSLRLRYKPSTNTPNYIVDPLDDFTPPLSEMDGPYKRRYPLIAEFTAPTQYLDIPISLRNEPQQRRWLPYIMINIACAAAVMFHIAVVLFTDILSPDGMLGPMLCISWGGLNVWLLSAEPRSVWAGKMMKESSSAQARYMLE